MVEPDIEGTTVRSPPRRMSKRRIDDFILRSKGWAEFYAGAAGIDDETDKGDCFERLVQVYMQSAPHMVSRYKHVWLRAEVPGDVKAILRLPDTDEGIDIIAETKYGEFHSCQAKFRANPLQALTMTEIATFTNLSFVHCKDIRHGLIAHTCGFPIGKREFLGNVAELGLDVWEDLNAEDWAAIQARIESREVAFAARLPRPHQQVAMTDAIIHFVENGASRGRLIMPCGTGKSLAAFFIAEQLNAQTIVVAVPSLALIAQSLKDWTREFLARGEVPDWFVVCSADDVGDISDDDHVGDTYEHGLETDTSVEAIAAWVRRTKGSRRRVVFVTYQSGPKFAEAAREVDLTVDFMILDEAHKTVGARHKKYAYLIFDENVKASRRMFMTATERVPQIEDDRVLSMDDVAIYGEQFHLLAYKAAVEQKIICDYEIVVMAVSQSDIAELVRKNKLVNTGVDGLDEAQAMRLATGIALKKMYQDRDVKHAISFHSSIFKAEQFREQQEALNAVETLGPSGVNLHISSKLTTTQRKRLMREFQTYERALMTNARCLTEGVDIPAIDCVVFADRKNSTVDIVQAAGRAMRTAPGKDKGYILIPLVVGDDVDAEGIEIFAKTSGFREVTRIVAALSMNDERIVEQFRVVYDGDQIPSRGGIIKFDGSVRLGLNIEFDRFVDAIEAKIWERLAHFSWRSYDEAVKFVHGLRLKGVLEWYAYCRGERTDLPVKPADIPRSPSYLYGDVFRERGGWGAWFGTDIRKGGWLPYDEAVKFVRNLKLKDQSEWFAYYRGERTDLPRKPTNIPSAPWKVYGDEFRKQGGLGAWLGTWVEHPKDRVWRSYDEAVKFVHELRLKNVSEWRAYIRGERQDLPTLPRDIPENPAGASTYVEAFRKHGGWGAWLGTGQRRGGWRSYDEAVRFVHRLGLKSRSEWGRYCRGERTDLPARPTDIPAYPEQVYGDELRKRGGLGAWLGTGTIPTKERRKRLYRSYTDAATFVHQLGLKNQKDWGAYCRGERADLPAKPADIPANPKQVYGDEFGERGGTGAWLGTGTIANFNREFLPYDDAAKFVHKLLLKSATEWRAYCRGERTDLPMKPSDIPASPWRTYGEAFRKRGGIGAWLGTGGR
jgi:superfamily II DNA or RNA helicase